MLFSMDVGRTCMTIRSAAALTMCALMHFPSTGASAQDSINTMMFIDGRCERFTIGSVRHSCSSVVYATLTNRRITFSVPLPSGALTFSGSKESQLDLTRYTLLIDSLSTGDGKSTNQYMAKGECKMHLSADGDFVHSVNCTAKNDVENVVLMFKGNGSRVKRVK